MSLLTVIQRLHAGLRKIAYADMHRIACGWAPQGIPSAQGTDHGSRDHCPLSFSPRSRKRLGWAGYICGQAY